MTSPPADAPLRFGRFELQPHERRLLADGVPLALGARAFDVLLALAARPGQLVGKQALLDLVWPGVVVNENNLATQIGTLRKLVGADVVATIPGRGYRFTARIEPPAADPAASTVAPAAPPGPVPQGRARTNLPAELPALQGRADALAELAASVDGHRLVTVVGAGGIGKSLLAQHLLQARRGAYPQGVCWVELAPAGDPGDAPGIEPDAAPGAGPAALAALAGAVANALDVDAGHGEPLAALAAAVAPLTLLLALDNAEHRLAEVAALCRALREAAPGLRLLVTSQAPLKLQGERVLRLGPLALPESDAPPAAQARGYGAVALFVERAQAVDGRYALLDADVAAVVATCRALDGLPLAIELAAARVPRLGAARLRAAMQDRLRLLTASRDRAAPARQQTLRAALAWSHDLLAPAERVVFRRLAVMAGGASLAFIEQVVADAPAAAGSAGAADDAAPDPVAGPLDAWTVLDALDALVDRSLVALQPASADDADDAAAREPRYRLLESPRAFALERLHDAGEHAALQRRHAQALAAHFEAAYDAYFDGRCGADAWLRRLEGELDHARDALAWARAAGDGACELAIGATLLRALPPSLHAERMALADACEARIAAAAWLPPLELRAWIELSCAWADTQKARSRAAAERALALARRLEADATGAAGDPASAAAPAHRFARYHALCRVAGATAQAGDVAASLAPLAELQSIEDARWPAQRLLWGTEAAQVIARLRGDRAEALQLSRRLLALDRARGSHASIALGNLVDAELAAGDARGATQSGAALVAALTGTRHEYSLAYARLNLCAAWLALDDAPQARTVAAAAWPQARRFELQHYAAVYLALLAALEGRPRCTARLLGHAEAGYAARDEAIEANEAAAIARAGARAAAALGGDLVERLRAEGRALADAAVAALAFGDADA